MKRIGLIGGMSWESTATYYRMINEAVRDSRGGLVSADIVMHSLDFSEVVALQKADRWDEAGALLGAAGARLANAGADCVLICTNTMHLVANGVSETIDIPLINIIDVTAKAIAEKGYHRPLLLATRYTMEHGFYTDRMRTHGLDPLVPDEDDRIRAHSIIFDELCAGQVRDTSRDAMNAMIEKAKKSGADSVILGCTEICLLLDPTNLPLPGFDSTELHASAAADFALAA